MVTLHKRYTDIPYLTSSFYSPTYHPIFFELAKTLMHRHPWLQLQLPLASQEILGTIDRKVLSSVEEVLRQNLENKKLRLRWGGNSLYKTGKLLVKKSFRCEMVGFGGDSSWMSSCQFTMFDCCLITKSIGEIVRGSNFHEGSNGKWTWTCFSFNLRILH